METRIINSAADLFHRFGIKTITMDDIAKELGMSKKTIYKYFSDKDKLVFQVIETTLNEEREKSEKIKLAASNAIAEIFMHMDLMKDMLTNINATFFYDLKKFHPAAFDFYQSFKSYFNDEIKRNLIRGINDGLYRTDIKVDILAKLRVETVDLAFDTTVFNQKEYNVIDIQIESLDHFLHGIVTEKGLLEYLKFKNNLK